jgi:chromate transporter
MRAGVFGGIAAWLGFTLPSVLVLIFFALLARGFDMGSAGWIHGLKIVAVAIVAHAVWGMGKKLITDRHRATIALSATTITLLWQTSLSQISIIFLAAIIGFFLYKNKTVDQLPEIQVPIKRSFAVVCLIIFLSLLISLPLLREVSSSHWIAMFDSFYRSGSLVFGGGHVVLPLLEREVVSGGWISSEDFLTGYGATQAVPGPLFTFAGYIGAVMNGWLGAAVATVAIFLPAFLLVMGALPFWTSLMRSPKIQGALHGINAAVVGILLSALYHPIWTSSILAPEDFVLACILFVMLAYWNSPSWLVVLSGVIGGVLISYL